MKAAMRQKVDWPHSCKVGSCGSCRATIVEGEGKYPSSPCDPTTLLHKEEMDNGMVIACSGHQQLISQSMLKLVKKVTSEVWSRN